MKLLRFLLIITLIISACYAVYYSNVAEWSLSIKYLVSMIASYIGFNCITPTSYEKNFNNNC